MVGVREGEKPSFSLGNLEFRTDSCFSSHARGTGCGPDHIHRYLLRSSVPRKPHPVVSANQLTGLWEHMRAI